MKQITFLKLLSFLVLLSLITVSCQKDEAIEQAVQTPNDEIIDNTLITNKEYCGNSMTFPLSSRYTQMDYGIITVSNDESNLYFDYDIDDGNGYNIWFAYIFVINDGDPVPTNISNEWNEDGTGHFYPYNFPYQTYPNGVKEHQEIISFTELESQGINLNECLDIVVGARLGNGVENQWVFAKSTLKTDGYHIDFCIEECTTFSGCETAYAYGGDDNDCFLNLNTQGNNWGWSNGGIAEGTYNWPIYAGAGQCNIANGTHVGTLIVEYLNGTATITYDLFSGISLEETHLHVGDTETTRLPLHKNGKFLTAPGKFQYSGGSSFTIENLSGEIWVTAHAVVCGEE